jgi:putative ABC transport system substrate-binding protein
MLPPDRGAGMRRREFLGIVGGAAAWPLAARAQQSARTWRVAFMASGALMRGFDNFKQELRALGYVEGKNLILDTRAAEGQFERLPAFANELVALHPDAIVAEATPAITAAQRATSTIPIVMCPATDPIGSGFVKSFARPGGNITGLANMYGDLTSKSLEVLHTILPGAKLIAVLMSSNPTHPSLYAVASAAARAIGITTIPVVAATPDDLERAFQDIAKANCGAVFVLADPFRPRIVALAAAAKIPTAYQYSNFVEIGGLVSYGADNRPMYTRAAQYVDKILKGANPADLPVEQPTTFELVLNLKTAKTLGLTVPLSLLGLADRIIE